MSSKRQGSSADFSYFMNTTLEEMYNGAERKLAIQRNVVCKDCIGSGLRSGAYEHYNECERCYGGGMETYVDDNRQQRRQCCMCGGSGRAIIKPNRCNQCKGKKFVFERFILDVDIKRGMFDGQLKIHRGEGHQKLDMGFGDFIITINEMSHPTFKRNGDDLSIVIKLNLTEALCGFQKIIKTLDNRNLLIQSEFGRVYSDGGFYYIMNEGMPIYRNRRARGNLIVNFEVSMPHHIQVEQIPLIEQILPQRRKLPSIFAEGEGEDCIMLEMEPTDVDPRESPYADQEFPTHQHDSQDQYATHEYGEYYENQGNDYHYDNYHYAENEHENEVQYHQEVPFDEARRSSKESLKSSQPR